MAGASLWQLLTAPAAVAVIAMMVLVAVSAQRSADRHRRVQVLVERVHGSSQAIVAITWQGVAEMGLATTNKGFSDDSLVRYGFSVWNGLTSDLAQLRAADHSASTQRLLADAGALFRRGIQAMSIEDRVPLKQAVAGLRTSFRPAVEALDRDALAAADAQGRVASHAEQDATEAYVGTLLVGLLVLVLIGIALHRLRRAGELAEARRAVERRTEARIRALIEHSSDVIAVVDPNLVIRWISPSVERTLGHDADALAGTPLTEFAHQADRLLLESHLAAGNAGGPSTFTARFRHGSGGWRHLEAIVENRVEEPEVQGFVLSLRDITERKSLEEELRHQAFHDALTGLANRALFEDRLAHALAGARRHGRPVAVLYLDLDDFKTINDSLGHSSGDELLRAVAIRIAGVVRVTDTAARLGGDEFAVLLEILEDDNDPELIAGRLLEALKEPFAVADHELRISASIGVARSDGQVGVDDLRRNADTAMYAAKEAGKGTVLAFEAGMHERVVHRLELKGDLQRGIETRQFELDYQPIVELDSGEICGVEALVRWAHPSRGRLFPGDFISLAEETGLIVPLGSWILHAACEQGARWQREFPERRLEMNVNVSTRQLHDLTFPETVASALQSSGLVPELLVLEITESLLPDDSEEILAQLHALKALGVRVAVDDFGTGYSALSRLQAYPVDVLKIDRSFIDGIECDVDKGQLVEGIVNLGESLRLQVVAEGIEEAGQAEQLRRMRSPLGQGFLFSRPVGSHHLTELLREGRPLTPASSTA